VSIRPFGHIGHFGAQGAGQSASTSWTDVLEEYAPTASVLVDEFTDPARKVAVLQAKLDAARKRGAPASEIAIIKAKLEAARREFQVEASSESAQSDWMNLVALGIGGIVILAGSGAFYFMVKALGGQKR
jgi:hypothetical protein